MAQVVGGESRGEGVAAGPQTDAGPVAAGLGQFVEQVMRPHVQQRQEQEFWKGAAKAQEGVAIDQIVKSDSPLNKIFGPTSFEQGAQFFTAKSVAAKLMEERYARVNDYANMTPDDFGREMAETTRRVLTGDPATDTLIQSGLVEASMPLLNTVSKARRAYQQEHGLASWTAAVNGEGDLYRSAAVTQRKLSPTEHDNPVIETARQNFLGSLAKPEGMDEAVYKDGLRSLLLRSMQNGNFHVVGALKQAGVDSVFDEDETAKLEDSYHRYGQRTLHDFTATDEKWQAKSDEYERERARLLLHNVDTKWSALQFRAHLASMNDYARAMTGVDEPVYSFDDIKSEVRSIASLNASSYNRQLEKSERARERAADRQQEANEDAQEYAAAGAAWSSGDINGAIAAGIPAKHFDRLGLAAYRSGQFGALAKAFRVSHEVSPLVKADILAEVDGATGAEYGKNMERAHANWKAMRAASPGMATYVYGEWDAKLRTFDALSPKLGPNAAYLRAFGDPARYSSAALNGAQRGAADDAISGWASSQQPSRLNLFRKPMSRSGMAVLKAALRDRVAMAVQNSATPVDALVPEMGAAILADGSVQTAGGQAWFAPIGAKPFRARLGVLQDEADIAFGLVGERLKQAGLPAGNAADMEIAYVHTPKGDDALRVTGRKDGESRTVIVGIPDFKAYLRNVRSAETASTFAAANARAAAKRAVGAKLDPYRRIKGESGLNRAVRINREVAAGAPATKQF